MSGDIVLGVRLKADGSGLVGEIRVARKELDGLGVGANQTRGQMQRLGDQSDQTSRQLSAVRGVVADLARGFATGLGISGFLGTLGAGIAGAREYGKSLAEVSTLLSDTSGLEEQGQQVRALARQYGTAATEQSQALYQILSSGQQGAKAMAALDASNRLAIGGVTDIRTAADGLTSVLNAYGDRVRSASDVSDVLFVGMRQGKTTVGELSGSLGLVAPIAATIGVEFDELVSSISAVTLGGVKTAEAVTQVRGVLAGILKPTSEASELSAKLGLDFSTQAVAAKGLSGFLADVREKTGGNKEAMSTLFGSVEAVSAIFALTGGQADAFSNTLAAMKERTGETDVAFGKMSQSADFALNRMKAAAQDSLVTLGDKLLTVLVPAALLMADNIESITDAIATGFTIAGSYFALFIAAPAIYAAVEIAGWRFVAMLTATNVGFAASIAQIGLLSAAATVLFGAFAGWQIGAWLRQNFMEAQLAGIAFVEGSLVGWERIKQGAAIAWEGIKATAIGAFNTIKSAIADTFAKSASGAELLGLDDMAAGLKGIEASLRPASSASDDFAAAVEAINKEADANIANVRAITGDMADYAIEAFSAKDAAVESAGAIKQVAEEASGSGVALGEASEKAKELAKAIEAVKKAGLQESLSAIRDESASLAEVQNLKDQLQLMKDGVALEDAAFQIKLRNLEASGQLAAADAERYRAQIKGVADVQAANEKAVDDFLSLNVGGDFAAGFDEASAALGTFVDRFGQLVEVQTKYDEARLAAGDDVAKLAKLEAKYQNDQIKLYGDITGAAKGFFKEGTSGYKAMETAERAFRAIELVLAAKSLAAKLLGIQGATAAQVASQAVHVAVEGVKATASGVAAAASAMVGLPFPANLAALAATVAALVGIGVAITGGGGGGSSAAYTPTAASQGKGTVFGDSDAESESVTNSLDLLSDLADKQLGVSQSQLQTLRAIEQGFNSTASAVARAIEASSIDNIQRIDVAPGQTIGGVASGGLSGSFARDPTSREYFDAIFGGDGTAALRERLSEEVDGLISDSIGEVFTGLVDTITSAAATLYIDGENLRQRIESIGLTLDSIDLEGLNGDEIIQRINAVFSAVGDTVVGELLPGIKEFQRVGEGLYETLIRVAAETAAAVGALDKIGNSFGQSSAGLEQARISEQLIELAGGIDNFADNVTGFIDTFLSEAEKSAQLRADLTAEFADLGMALPATRDGVRDIVKGIDVTTESGRQAFTTLTALNGELGKFYDELEQREKERQDLLGSVTDQIEELTTPADQLARLRLDREFEKLRAEAARLNLDSTVIDQLYDLKRAALEAGGAVAGAASAVSSSVTAQFNQGVQTQITQEQLVGQDLALFNLNLQREKMLADATAAAGDLAEVERLFAIRREEIITEYREKELEAQRQAAERAASAAASAASAAASRAQQAREAAQSAAAEQARIRQEALQQELEDARRRAGLLATVQDEINNFDLTGVALELQNLQRDFDARRQEFRDAGIIDVSLLDQLEALKRESILAAQALQQANFAQGIREQIEDLTLTGLDLDLVKLEREFADLRAQAAEIGVGTDLVDQLYALKRSALDAAEATRLQTEANEAAALPGRRADFLDGLRVRLETPSLTGQAKELLDLENSIADLRTQAAELGLTDVVQIEQIYQQERAAILQSYVDRAREIEERAQADRLNQLRAAYDREAGVLQATVDRFDGITADLRSFRSQLFGADVSRATPEQRYNDLRAQLDALSPMVSLGDETALAQVRDLGQQFIDASQAVNSSSAAFFADRDYLASLVDSAIGGAQIERDLAQEQLDLLTEQVSALISIEEAVVSVAQAIANLNGGALPAPAAFATGGAFSNSVVSRPTLFPLGLMGEAGPEAILPLSRNADGSLGVRSSGGGGDAEQLKELQKQTRHLEAQVRLGQSGTVEILAALGRIEERMENLEENARHAESAR